MISTRGRYALRFIIDLAEQGNGKCVSLKSVAERQQISPKYLEQIVPVLTKNKLIEATSGKGGGYHLTREPKDYTVGEILSLTESSLAPVACLECDAPECKRKDSCRTLPMWEKLNEITMSYLYSVTVADLAKPDETE